MENFPGYGPDFSSLAEISKSPEKKKDDDDDEEDDKKEKRPSLFERAKTPEKLRDDKPEKKEPTEKEVPLKKLAESEKTLVKDGFVEARLPEVEAELTQQEAIEPLAAAAYLEKVADLDEVNDETIETAVAEVAEELGIETPETEEVLENEAPEDTLVSLEAKDKDEEPVPIPPTPLPTGGSTPTLPPLPPSGGGLPPAGGGSALPPFSSGGTGGNALPAHPNFAVNQPPETVVERRPVGRYVLVGGIVGYLIGRRRGRIKTEKKLLPIQRKLEEEVNGLHQKIAAGEEKIRNLVHEQVIENPGTQTQILEKLKVQRENRPTPLETKPEKLPMPEAVPKPPELLGRFAVLSERPAEFERPKTPEKPKAVGLMTIPELLIIAERIPIERSNIKRLFEVNRLNEEGLKRVVQSFLRGERYERVIHDNLATPEQGLDHETLVATEPTQTVFTPQGADQIASLSQPGSQATPSQQSAVAQTYQPVYPTDDGKTKKSASRSGIIVAVVVVVLILILLAIF